MKDEYASSAAERGKFVRKDKGIAPNVSVEPKVATMPVFKWGDSLAVCLPESLVRELGLKEGDELDIVGLRSEVDPKGERRSLAVGNLTPSKFELPPDYKFDRDEANER
jgi:antitoxin MazE